MKLAVVGATGMVGEVMLRILSERNFPLTELIPVASERSVGKNVYYQGNSLEVLGPVDSPLLKIKKNFRSRLLIRFNNRSLMQK